MKKILRELKPFKIPLIMIAFFGLLYLVLNFIVPGIRNHQASKTPIVKIEAINEQVYQQGATFRVGDFEVKATHQSGKISTLSDDQFTVSPKTPDPIGDNTRVTVSLKSNPHKKTTVLVKNDRKELVSIPCGKPELESVKAVVYSNGELSFEGEGDVLQYDTNGFPWKDVSDVEIKSVTFDRKITPTSMDYWFSGMDNLTYIGPLPRAVESIVGICEDCPELKKAPDWSHCPELIDVTDAYKGCEKLKEIPPLTESIRNASGMCTDCIELQNAPDLSKATSLLNTSSMFEGCEGLTTVTSMPPKNEIMDSMFEDCINLKEMPELPESTLSMENSFANNMSLREVKRIPSKVMNLSGCFSDCSKIKGELQVDATPEKYNNFLQNACSATKLNLTGSSGVLNELALTNDTQNITVAGAKPVEKE